MARLASAVDTTPTIPCFAPPRPWLCQVLPLYPRPDDPAGMACLMAAPCSGSGKTPAQPLPDGIVRQRGETIQTFKLDRITSIPRPCSAWPAAGPAQPRQLALWLRLGWQRQLPLVGAVGRSLPGGRVMGPLRWAADRGLEGSSAETGLEPCKLPVVLVVEGRRQLDPFGRPGERLPRPSPPASTLPGRCSTASAPSDIRPCSSEARRIAMPLLVLAATQPNLPSRHWLCSRPRARRRSSQAGGHGPILD